MEMKYIKKLNIDFDQWGDLKNDNKNIKLFIKDKKDKYALYLSRYQYINIFIPYLEKNNIELYWRSRESAINYIPNEDDMVIYKISYENNRLFYTDLEIYKKYYNKIKLLNI
jgi:hypothetical protein